MKKQLLLVKYRGLKMTILENIKKMSEENFTKSNAIKNTEKIFDMIISDIENL